MASKEIKLMCLSKKITKDFMYVLLLKEKDKRMRLTIKVLNVQVCDATGDQQIIRSSAHKNHLNHSNHNHENFSRG